MSSIKHYKQNWWLYLVEGILLVAFGLAAAIVPGETFFWLGRYFGFLLVGLGIVALVGGIRGSAEAEYWWMDIVLGILELILGFYLLRHPAISIASFAVLAAIVLIVRSIVAVFQAFDDSLSGLKRVLLAAVGTFGFLAGLVVWSYPLRGTIVFIWVLGLYALIAGPVKMVVAFEAKEA